MATQHTLEPYRMLDERRWEKHSRSHVLSPLYVQRYSGPRIDTVAGWHPYWELVYVFAGTGQHVDSHGTLPMRSGVTLLIPPACVHREAASGTLDTFWMGISGSFLYKLPTDHAGHIRSADLAPLVDLLWMRTRLPFWQVSGAEIDGLALGIAARIVQILGSVDDLDAAESADRLSSVLHYLHGNYEKPIAVSDLAAIGGVSEGHFFRWFRSRTGTTPIEYLTKIRLEHAQEMLGQTTMSIHAVSRAIGFEDPLYFSRTFAKHYGIGPREWRQQKQCS